MVEISATFMQSEVEELFQVRFEGVRDEILVKIQPKIYTKYDVNEKVQTFI